MSQQSAECGLQPIGNLVPKLLNSAEPKAATQPQSSPSSSISGSQCQLPAASSSTGTQLSATDAELSKLRDGLRQHDAEAVELAMSRWSKSQRASPLRQETDSQFDLVGFSFCRKPTGSERDLLLSISETINRPSGEDFVFAHAARCLAGTKSRELGSADVEGYLRVLAAELAEFPNDVVASAFRKWMRREKWWPAVSEILDQCQRDTRWRRSLQAALKAAA